MKINEFYYHLRGRADFLTKNHTHDEIEIIECVEGRGTVLKGDRLYPLEAGYLYIIDARSPHIVHPIDYENYVRNKIVIDANSFYAFFHEAGLDETVQGLFLSEPIPTAGQSEVDRLFRRISMLCQSEEKWDIGFAHGYILELLHFAAMHRAKAPTTVASDRFLEKILAVIAETDGKTTLLEISERLHVNKYYLCHLFKEKTGVTLSEYIAEKRYEKSLVLLKDKCFSVEAIAFACGFASASSFTRFFKKKNGLSPLAYRKKLDSERIL